MKYFVLFAIASILFIPLTVYAQEVQTFSDGTTTIFRGPDYIKTEKLVNGQIQGTWQSAPLWIFNGANYHPLLHLENSEIIQVETAHGSIILNKQTCGFSIFKTGHIKSGDIPLFSDSIVARMATDGTDDWTHINSINNAACEPSWDGTEFVARKQSAAGILDYKYINTGQIWKTQLEATNLSNANDKKFGFTQTIELNRDTIKFGGQERNLDNFDQVVFDRTFIENNEAKVLNLLNGVNYDFDIAFDNLWSIKVYDTGTNSSRLAFDFARNAPVVLPNETLI